MYAPERQDALAALVKTQGRVSVPEAAAAFGVTQETVRRDLDRLERAGLLRRVHGGAVPTASLLHVERGVAERDRANAAEKTRIAVAAVKLLPEPGGSVLLDAGTTTAHLAARLPADRQLDVITNSVPIASVVAATPARLQVVGGRVRNRTQAAVGPEATRFLADLRVDVAFLGANGLTVDHGASTPDPEEASVKRAMVAAARRVVVLVDSTKMGLEHLVRFASPERIDVVVTDDAADPQFIRGLRAADIEVVVA